MVPCLHLRVYQEALTAKPVVFLAIHQATFLRALLQGYATRTESGLGTRTRFVEVLSTFSLKSHTIKTSLIYFAIIYLYSK